MSPAARGKAGKFVSNEDQTVEDTITEDLSDEELAKIELEHLERAHKEPTSDAQTKDNPEGVPAETHTHNRSQLHVTHTHPIFADSIHA